VVPSSTHRLPLTRISLYYLFTYLTLTGLGLMFFPSATLRLMQSNATDSHDMARLAGIPMLAIGLVVSQIIRHSLDVLYPATVVIRLVIRVYVAWLCQHSGNPFFAAVLGLGILLTGSAYFSESRATIRADG
jgi:uncharacterized protein YjeT (DUF2065 family)